MDTWLTLHPKVKAAVAALVLANAALAVSVIQGTGSVRDLLVGVSVSAVGLVAAYFGGNVKA